MPTSDIRGIRRSSSSAVGGVQAQINSNERDELLVAQGLPPYTEITRLGQGWTVQTTTLFAPIAAYPSTTARLEGFNNSGNLAMVIVDLFAAQVLSTAATQTYAIGAMVTTAKAAPTNTALVLASLSGKGAITTTAAGQLITAVDTTVVANGWRPWGNPQAWGTAAATPGNAWSAEVNGKLVVPPGASICVAPFGSIATASSFQCGFSFYWAPLTTVGL